MKTFERSMRPRTCGRNEPCPCGSWKKYKNAARPEGFARRRV
ncbi:hypothetical protein EKG40_03680 [Pseudomonas moorei]|nr:hypothetical protein EKG40_03680 [Pseudomonas moorei]